MAVGSGGISNMGPASQPHAHVGSAAVILGRRPDDQRAGRDTPDDAAPAVWEEWNAKSPRAQVDDGLAADAAFLRKTEPERQFTVDLRPDLVSLVPSAPDRRPAPRTAGGGLRPPGLRPARPGHMPPSVGDPALLQRLRLTFPGP